MKQNKLKISLSESQFSVATGWTDWQKEDLSYALGFDYGHGGGRTIIVREILKPAPSELERSSYAVEPTPEFLCRLYDRLEATGSNVLIQNHTHPFTDTPDFSGIDDESARRLNHDLKAINPNAEVVQFVFGLHNRRAKSRMLLHSGKTYLVDDMMDVEIVGIKGISACSGVDKSSAEDSLVVQASEDRNQRTFGDKGIQALHRLRVLILGAGGLGSAMAYLLSRLGIRRITVYDYQRIEGTDVNRFYFVTKPHTAVGKFKASFVAKGMRVFNRFGKYHAVNASIYSEKALAEAVKNTDLIVLALDNDGPRSVAMAWAARYAKPLVNVANSIYLNENKGIKNSYASCQWFIPREPQYPCLRCQGALNEKEIDAVLMSERLKEMRKKAGYIVGTDESPSAQVIPINSAAAGIAAWELALWATGIRAPKSWVHYDLMTHSCEQLTGIGDPDCTICGTGINSCLATGDADLMLTTANPEPAA